MKLNDVVKTKPAQEYKIFCDMDGVLVDFLKGIKKLVPGYTEKQYDTDPAYARKMWKTVQKYTAAGGKFWYDLDPMPDMRELWNFIKPYDAEILTATGVFAPETVGIQKRNWAREHLGNDVIVHTVQKAREKCEYAEHNFILIDDKAKAIDPWIDEGGIGILHTSAKDTIHQLRELGLT